MIGDPPRARRRRHALNPAISHAAYNLDRLKQLMQDLYQRYDASEHYRSADEPVSTLTSREEVTSVFDFLQNTVRTDWMQLITGPFLPLAGPLPPERSVVSINDINCRRRVVYEKDAMSNPVVMAGLRNTLRWGGLGGGAQIRFCLPMMMIKSAPLIAGQIARFEEEWEKAIPYNVDVSHAPEELDVQDRRTDKVIARVCGCSPRTVGRSIQRMRQLAGVSRGPPPAGSPSTRSCSIPRSTCCGCTASRSWRP